MGHMSIKVKLLTGSQIEIYVHPKDSIWQVKERVEDFAGIDPKHQRLIYCGRQLKDERSVRSYNIDGGCVLHLVIALRGGGGMH